MKQTLLLFALLLFFYSGKSQVEDTQLRATLLPIGLSSEFGLSDNITFDLNAGFQPSYSYSTTTVNGQQTNSSSSFGLDPNVAGGFRYYYNMDTREDQGLKTSGNSANYVALSSNLFWAEINDSSDETDKINIYMFGPVWGLQRTYNSNIYLDFNIGLGYLVVDEVEEDDSNSGYSGLGPNFNFKLGYSFLK